jgi:hypothetical protein
VRVDGRRVSGWQVIPKGLASTPFQNQGPALDGDVVEVALPSRAVGTGRVVELDFRGDRDAAQAD